MARLTLNPNSYLTNKPHILAIDADGLYALNRSISSLNNAVWGLQPTSADYLSGITIDRLKPLSSNTSLCSDIYQMDFALSALKFFATRPFIMCENVEDMNSKARSPLAVYLTPLSAEPGVPPTEEAEKEWLFFLPESISTFEDLAALYEASEDDPNFRLSSLIAEGGYWECIGTTALTESILQNIVFKNDSSEITGSLSVTNSFTVGGEGRATISAGLSSFNVYSDDAAADLIDIRQLSVIKYNPHDDYGPRGLVSINPVSGTHREDALTIQISGQTYVYHINNTVEINGSSRGATVNAGGGVAINGILSSRYPYNEGVAINGQVYGRNNIGIFGVQPDFSWGITPKLNQWTPGNEISGENNVVIGNYAPTIGNFNIVLGDIAPRYLDPNAYCLSDDYSFYVGGYKMLELMPSDYVTDPLREELSDDWAKLHMLEEKAANSGKIPFERLPMKSILSTSVTTDHGSGDRYVQQGIVAADSYYYKSNGQIVLSAHEDYPGTDVKPILEFEASLSTDSITPLLFNLPEYVGGDMNVPISVELKNLYGYYLTSWGAVDLDLSCFGNIHNGQVIELKRSQDPYYWNRYETVITADNGLSTKFMLDVGSAGNPNESYRIFDIFIENEAPDEFDSIYFRQVDTIYDEGLTKSFDFIQTPARSLPPYGQISISPLITYNQAKKILRKAVNIDSISAMISGYNDFVLNDARPRTTNEIANWCKDLHLALSSLIVGLNG